MSLYEAVNEKLKVVGTGMLQSRKVRTILRLVGSAKINVTATDTGETLSAEISRNDVKLNEDLLKKPHVSITGDNGTLSMLLNTLSKDKYKEAEEKGMVEVKSHGIKGRLLVSRVRKMFGT